MVLKGLHSFMAPMQGQLRSYSVFSLGLTMAWHHNCIDRHRHKEAEGAMGISRFSPYPAELCRQVKHTILSVFSGGQPATSCSHTVYCYGAEL